MSTKTVYRFNSVRILIVDGNGFLRSILLSILNALGVGGLLIAENGREARDVLAVTASREHYQDIDIVLADIRSEGLELLKWIRAHDNDKIKFVPVILMGSDVFKNTVMEARDAGVTEFLAKPMSIKGVSAHLLAVVDKARPFIKAPNYFGPDRRRREQPFDLPDRRIITQDKVALLEEKS